MPRMIKFAIAPQTGTLVYRTGSSAGNAVRGRYEVRDNRVYRSGRLVGYIGRPTAAQSRTIAEKDRTRATRQRRETLRRTLDELETRYQSSGAVMFETVNGRTRPTHVYSRRELTTINFGHLLNEAVSQGKMTRTEAYERLERYMNTEDSRDRTAQWDELKDRFETLGFPYP